MISNIQSWLGYSQDERAPEGKLFGIYLRGRQSDLHNGFEVRDERGAPMAVFRNRTDAERYIADMTTRIETGRKAYEAECKQQDDLPEDKVRCPICNKAVAWIGLGQHKRVVHGKARQS